MRSSEHCLTNTHFERFPNILNLVISQVGNSHDKNIKLFLKKEPEAKENGYMTDVNFVT